MERFTKAAVRAQVGGNHDIVDTVLDRLVDQPGPIHAAADENGKRTRRYWYDGDRESGVEGPFVLTAESSAQTLGGTPGYIRVESSAHWRGGTWAEVRGIDRNLSPRAKKVPPESWAEVPPPPPPPDCSRGGRSPPRPLQGGEGGFFLGAVRMNEQVPRTPSKPAPPVVVLVRM